MSDVRYWIWFSMLSSIEAAVKAQLLEYYDSVEDIYNCADYSEASFLSIKDKTVLMNKKLDKVDSIIDKSQSLDIQIITYDSQDYPDQLRNIYNPPYVLYVKGTIPDWDKNLFIAVVGTRKCSEYGISATRKFCREFAEYGVITVSGIARGIDSEVASSTLSAGGRTIAVLGCGIDICYPPENAQLISSVIDNGLLISEFPPGTPPLPHHFPIRNRIISGIANGVLVSESPKKSGSLITADLALEQGKEVFSIPGSIFQKTSEGTNNLISSGSAKLVTNAMDVLSDFERFFVIKKETPTIKPVITETKTHIPEFDTLSDNERKVANLLIDSPMHADEIMRLTNLPASEITTIFSMLEFSGIIERQAGNIYKLKV